MSETNHKQVIVQCNGKEIEVDEGMSELLKLLWSLDIETCYSCQGDESRKAYIQFESEGDVNRFLNLTCEPPDSKNEIEDSFYGKIVGLSKEKWTLGVSWRNRGEPKVHNLYERIIQSKADENDFRIQANIRFPASDIKKIVQILKRKRDGNS